MAEKQPEPTSADFEAAEKKILEQTEQYRERYLSVRLSLYAGFFAFEGIAVAAGTFIAARSPVIAPIVISISLVAMFLPFSFSPLAPAQVCRGGIRNFDQVAE